MYKTIIFDLDDTLTNDYENIKQAFKIVMEYQNEEYTEEKFLKFYKIDKQTWKDRAAGKILTPYEDNIEKKVAWIRGSRFVKYYDNQITIEKAIEINNVYMDGMKEKVVAREGAFEIIKYLYDKGYKLIIATNGPAIALKTKLEKLKIDKFIDTMFSAEGVGFMKPQPQFYEGLLNKVNIESKEEILFIGDDLDKDIKGGNDNGIDVCWCNYNGEVNEKYNIKYEIHKLEELRNVL